MFQEVEFIAEDIDVEITPNFTSPAQREVKVLLFKNVGTCCTLNFQCPYFFTPVPTQISSFEAQSCERVPLWLALSLKKRSKCTITIPNWLKTEKLDSILKTEQREEELQKIDFHYVEVALSLCKHAREDMTDWYQVYDLVVS
jgi:GINS complex subunit 2